MAAGEIFKMKLAGGHELDSALMALGSKGARNVVTRAMRKTMNPVVKAIRTRVKNDLSTMNAQARAVYSRQIGLSIRVERGGVVGRVRAKSTKAQTAKGMRNFARLAHLFEKGVDPHTINQPKRHRVLHHPGIKSRPIWEETFDSMARRMVVEFRDDIFQQLLQEWNKK